MVPTGVSTDALMEGAGTHIDSLVLGPFLLEKTGQATWKEETEWQQEFQLD